MGLVWNDTERRLRTPWRLLLGLLVVLVTTALAGGVAGVLLGRVDVARLSPAVAAALAPVTSVLGGLPASLQFSLAVVVSGLATVLGVWVAGRLLDRRRFVDFGFYVGPDWWADLGFGLLLGLVLVSLVFVGGLLGGWVALVGVDPSATFLAVVAAFVVVGLSEELLVRGYLLKNLVEGFTGPLGVGLAAVVGTLLTSVLFAALHAANPNATPVALAVIALAGVLFSVAYLLTGELGLPVGLHVSWNASLAAFGFPVSGIEFASLVTTRVTGRPAVTGGAFGPEAGLLGLGAVLLGIVAVALYTYVRYGDMGLAPDIEDPHLF